MGVNKHMANWSDPRLDDRLSQNPGLAGGSIARDAAFDAGLKSYMLKVYNYMATGVLLTGAVAFAIGNSDAINLIVNPRGGFTVLGWIALFSPLAFVFLLGGAIQRFSDSTAKMLFYAFAALMGVSMSTIFLRFMGSSIAETFFATAAAFAGLSLWGYTTKKDLSGWGSFLIMGVVGLIIASLLNMFVFKSGMGALMISGLGVLIFAGLTAYDTQKIKSLYYQVAGSDMLGKTAIMGALSLYLDFVNMFQFLLSFMGNRD